MIFLFGWHLYCLQTANIQTGEVTTKYLLFKVFFSLAWYDLCPTTFYLRWNFHWKEICFQNNLGRKYKLYHGASLNDWQVNFLWLCQFHKRCRASGGQDRPMGLVSAAIILGKGFIRIVFRSSGRLNT